VALRRPFDELVEQLLAEAALAQLDEALEGEATHGLEHASVLAGLGEELAEDRAADGVVEPGADGGVACEVCHGCPLLLVLVRVCCLCGSTSTTGQHCPVFLVTLTP